MSLILIKDNSDLAFRTNEGNLTFGAERVRPVEEVFVGEIEPTEDRGYKIWIDPSGEAGSFDVDLSEYALKSEIPDVSPFQTEEQVKSLIDLALEEVENGAY